METVTQRQPSAVSREKGGIFVFALMASWMIKRFEDRAQLCALRRSGVFRRAHSSGLLGTPLLI
jgi:hypothetical protein